MLMTEKAAAPMHRTGKLVFARFIVAPFSRPPTAVGLPGSIDPGAYVPVTRGLTDLDARIVQIAC
jgi:hypothetical protein